MAEYPACDGTPSADLSRVERFERRTQWPLAALAVVFLAAYAWPILVPSLAHSMRRACETTNYVIWVLFGIEFSWRLHLASRRANYAVRNIADVLMLALPVLRPLRVLRLLALLQMLNRRAAASLRGRVVVFVTASAILVLFSASLAVLDAERGQPGASIETFGDGLWWAAATMTTVGYGDDVPVTGQGRAVGFALMLAGIALLGVVTASIASWLIDRVREVDTRSQAATRGDIDALRGEIAALRDALATPAANASTESAPITQ